MCEVVLLQVADRAVSLYIKKRNADRSATTKRSRFLTKSDSCVWYRCYKLNVVNLPGQSNAECKLRSSINQTTVGGTLYVNTQNQYYP